MNRYAPMVGCVYIILFVVSLIMQWGYVFAILLFIGCALGLYGQYRRIRTGELSLLEVKENLKEMGIACAAVFILCMVIAGIADYSRPGSITTEGFIRGYIVMVIIVLILWGIGKASGSTFQD
jgi:hypothetical protein